MEWSNAANASPGPTNTPGTIVSVEFEVFGQVQGKLN